MTLTDSVISSFISLVDYFLIRRTLVKVSHLLTKDETSIYWYARGFNWRSIIAVLLTIWIPFRKVWLCFYMGPMLICLFRSWMGNGHKELGECAE